MTVQRSKPKLEPIPDEVKAALVRYNNSILLSLLARKTFSSESESSAHPRITSDLANSTTSREAYPAVSGPTKYGDMRRAVA